MFSTRYDRQDHADDAPGVADQIAIVNADDAEPDCLEEQVSTEISATGKTIGVVRFTVALDEESIADQQISTMAVPRRNARLRGRDDAGIGEQDAHDAFRARFSASVGARRDLTSPRHPGSGGAQHVAACQGRTPQRRVENRDRLRGREDLRALPQGLDERLGPEGATNHVSVPQQDGRARGPSRRLGAIRAGYLHVEASHGWDSARVRHPQAVLLEGRHCREATSDGGGESRIRRHRRKRVDAQTRPQNETPRVGPTEAARLRRGEGEFGHMSDAVELG